MAWRQGFRFFSSSESYQSYSTSLEEEEHHQQYFQHNPARANTHRLVSNLSSVAHHESSRGLFNRYNSKKQQPEYMCERVTSHVAVENHGTSYGQQPCPTTRPKTQNQYQPQPPPQGHPTALPSGDNVIDSNQAAKLYGGLIVTEYYPNPRTKVTRRAFY